MHRDLLDEAGLEDQSETITEYLSDDFLADMQTYAIYYTSQTSIQSTDRLLSQYVIQHAFFRVLL